MLQCEVQPGETLVSISIREKVPVVGLRRLNKLYGNEIFPGQILKLRSKVTDSGPIEDSDAFTRQDSHNRVSLYGSEASNTATDDNIVPTQTPPLAPVRTLSFVDNMLDVKTAIATTAGEKLSVMRSMMSSKRIPIGVPEIPARQRSSSSASVASLSISYGERKSAQSDEELDKVPPILIGKRNILTADQATKLRRFLPTMQQIESWKLIYSVLNDGADLDSFFRRTKSHKYTLIIVQTINGELFGGFNSMEWMTSPNFCKS
jgi:LysM domain